LMPNTSVKRVLIIIDPCSRWKSAQH